MTEDLDRRLLRVRRLQRDVAPVHQIGHALAQRHHEELADSDVVNQHAIIVDDVDDVQRFAVLPVLAHVIEHLLDGPVFPHGDVVWRHQTPHGSRRVAEQRHRLRAFLRGEQREQLFGRIRRQLAQEPRSIVGRHVVQQLRDVLLPHRLDQRALIFRRQVLEDGRREPPRKNAKRDHLIVGPQLRKDGGEVLRAVADQLVSQRREVAAADQGREIDDGVWHTGF